MSRILRALQHWAERRMLEAPDLFIGGIANPYLVRWFVIPRNPLFNVYLHRVVRSDDDRALHDHPWVNLSILILGEYVEHTIDAGGIHRRTTRRAGDIKLRRAQAAHRLEVIPGVECWTLFITGPRLRQWGFHCPFVGWVHWRAFTWGPNGEVVGRGCGEVESFPPAQSTTLGRSS
jgi:hypothetical protein